MFLCGEDCLNRIIWFKLTPIQKPPSESLSKSSVILSVPISPAKSRFPLPGLWKPDSHSDSEPATFSKKIIGVKTYFYNIMKIKGSVKIYRVPRPGLGENLPKEVSTPFLLEKKSSPSYFSDKKPSPPYFS